MRGRGPGRFLPHEILLREVRNILFEPIRHCLLFPEDLLANRDDFVIISDVKRPEARRGWRGQRRDVLQATLAVDEGLPNGAPAKRLAIEANMGQFVFCRMKRN